MTQDLPPLLLKPHYVPKPWGGRRMADLLGRTDLPPGPVGESWEAFDLTDAGHAAGCSRVDGGPYDGRPLREVLGAPFPLLVKVLDASEDLSIQVHPDGLDGGEVKEEAWVALAPGGAVAVAEAGTRFVSAEIEPGAWVQRLRTEPLHAYGPEDPAPTVVHVPAGTVHAILAGALVLEVQNPVDLTWRVDDYGRVGLDGRPRDLHLSEAKAQLSRPTPQPTPCVSGPAETGGWLSLLRGERFAMRLHGGGQTPAVPPGAAYLAAPGLVTGHEGGKLEVPAHRTVLLPSGAASIACRDLVIALATR